MNGQIFSVGVRNFAQIFGLKHLRAVNKYFWKYRMRFLWGLVFIILSNYFRILTPQVTGYVVNSVEKELRDSVINKKTTATYPNGRAGAGQITPQAANRQTLQDKKDTANYDILVKKFIRGMDKA